MTQQYNFTVSITVDHIDGRFRCRDAIASALAEILETAKDDLYTDDTFTVEDTQYKASEWKISSNDGDRIDRAESPTAAAVRAALDQILSIRPTTPQEITTDQFDVLDDGQSQLYRTCPKCGADLVPEPFEHDGTARVGFSCPEHGLHTIVDPFEGER